MVTAAAGVAGVGGVASSAERDWPRPSDQQGGGIAVRNVITAQVDADARALLRLAAACGDAELNREITGDARAEISRPEALISVGLLGRGERCDARCWSAAALLFWSNRRCGAVAGELERGGIRHGGFSQRTTPCGPRGGEPAGEMPGGEWMEAATGARLSSGRLKTTGKGIEGGPDAEIACAEGCGDWPVVTRVVGTRIALDEDVDSRALLQYRQACRGGLRRSRLWRGVAKPFSTRARR